MPHVQLTAVIVVVRKFKSYTDLAGIQSNKSNAKNIAAWYVLEHRAMYQCQGRPKLCAHLPKRVQFEYHIDSQRKIV
jgi:hypothetical protein